MIFTKAQKIYIALVALVIGIAIITDKFSFTLAFFLAFPLMVRLVRYMNSIKNHLAIEGALPTLDVIYGGVRYLGSESEVVTTRRVDDPREPGPLRFEQLCRTKSGAWFCLYFETINGSGFARGPNVKPLRDHDAAIWLEQADHEQYRRFFGEPKLA